MAIGRTFGTESTNFSTVWPINDVSASAIVQLPNSTWVYRYGTMVVVHIAIAVSQNIPAGAPILDFPHRLFPEGNVVGCVMANASTGEAVSLYLDGTVMKCERQMSPGQWRGMMAYTLKRSNF